MTEASASTPVVRIYDRAMPRPVEFEGERIGHGTSERPDSVKWAEIEIYRLAAGGYMVHRLGYSLLYHREDTWCKTASGGQPGSPATVDDLPDEATPCSSCRPNPPRALGDAESIRYEFPRHTFDACKSAADVVEALTVIRYRDGSQPSIRFSGPVKQALREAADNDQALYDILPRALIE